MIDFIRFIGASLRIRVKSSLKARPRSIVPSDSTSDSISDSDSVSDSSSDYLSDSDSTSDSEFIPDSDSGNNSSSHTNNSNSGKDFGTLPKTGEENGPLAGVGGMLAGLGMLAAIAAKKRKEKKEN
ncbi:LPXTG cell wall anchor domain-containing protein [Lactococcus lactis]|uniref:LPXTG cell wall anchor domain-containing protein n=1 Tax=Lactococcus lactis TaxID=1358 RepID=UPI001784DE62|nr:LPXTG cell wall anchor domain-containing protein [Lactococcus lactis]MBD5855485.1 LPXTG cell wall anchor domain-containing protein [Lactococcus lactis]